VNSLHFTHSIEGGLSQAMTGKHSLAKWVYFNPKELTIGPRQQRAVRFVLVPRGRLEEGEYWGAMELESLQQREVVVKDPEGKEVKVKTVATIMVPIFGTVGDVRYEGEIQALELAAVKGVPFLHVLLANTGTGRLGAKGTYEITDAAGKLVERGEAGRAYVLRGAKRWFRKRITTDLPEGTYAIKVAYAAEHLSRPLEYTTKTFWKPPPKPASQPASQPASGPASRPAGRQPTPATRQATAPSPRRRPRPGSRPVADRQEP
jgi:hypothetical protein